MDEMANGISSAPQESVAPSLTSTTQDAPSSAPEHVGSSERLLKQSEVNEIVKRAKDSAVEQYKRLHVEQPEYARKKFGDPPQVQQTQPQNGNFSEEHFRKVAAEEAQRLRDQWVQDAQSKAQEDYAKKVVDNFWNKVNPGKEKYEDFEKVTGDINLSRFPNTVQLLAEHVENSGDVLYELGRDRLKLAQLEQLSAYSPEDAIVQVRRLSSVIKDNESAKNASSAPEPLSQLRPTTSTTSNGVLSVRDFKAKYRG